MKFLFFLLAYCFGLSILGQVQPVVKKISVEFTSKKPKKNKYNFDWSKEFDEIGILINYSANNSGNIIKNVDYKYDSIDRIIYYKSYQEKKTGDKIVRTFNFYYPQDSIIKFEQSITNDTINDFEKTIFKYDNYGNLVLRRQINHTNSSSSYEKHNYTYDSLGRIKIDSNCSFYPNCQISWHYWKDNKLTVKMAHTISRYTRLNMSIDTLFYIKDYTFHSNDSISSLETHWYSSLNGALDNDQQFFRYDSLGNILEFYLLIRENPGVKHNHQIYTYTYDNQNKLTWIKMQYFSPKMKRKIYHYRYTYEYW
ncbi:hypothetical protein [Crocinitomix catalasitica]|uniref:hypothetical protein n=1 Tax=Crocinitomix catalasitica TaxID=184607 RepID=UPI0004837B9F|nr:hypothetical protein [Crocinitomix catalasitica]